jgi:hypothetical protein
MELMTNKGEGIKTLNDTRKLGVMKNQETKPKSHGVQEIPMGIQYL